MKYECFMYESFVKLISNVMKHECSMFGAWHWQHAVFHCYDIVPDLPIQFSFPYADLGYTSFISLKGTRVNGWWHFGMETLSALLAPVKGYTALVVYNLDPDWWWPCLAKNKGNGSHVFITVSPFYHQKYYSTLWSWGTTLGTFSFVPWEFVMQRKPIFWQQQTSGSATWYYLFQSF